MTEPTNPGVRHVEWLRRRRDPRAAAAEYLWRKGYGSGGPMIYLSGPWLMASQDLLAATPIYAVGSDYDQLLYRALLATARPEYLT